MTQNSWNSSIPVPLPKGGTGATTLTGLLTGNGTSAITASAITDNFLVRASTSNAVQDSTVSVTDNGEMTNASQPAFLAYLASGDANVTGDGTLYIMGTNTALTEVFDQNSDFNTNGTFTAPVTGRYFFTANFDLASLGAANTGGYANFAASNRTFYTMVENQANARAVAVTANRRSQNYSVLMDMDAADTMKVATLSAGGTKIVDLSANATYFCGYLVC